ncbi:MAG TPA: hypothetical protein VN737_05285 [Bryobacteraceae bacterium]|nr:hypothetical protein [Bryobacteraceae bacterium]
MIVKGKTRKDGHALAMYFLTSEEGARRIFGTDPLGDTLTAMTEWDEIGSLTRGEKPLYHMQLCPDAQYPVTDAQWKRMAEIVLDELGAKGHDYELYFHPGLKPDGHHQPHAHLGICRTNRDTLKMLDLSYNYVAHERASARIALEFGWELVPGKHFNRDRDSQEEFPRQKLTKDEAEYENRTGLSKEDRVREITALKAAADSGPAFKAALEEAGYLLAKGDRGYLVIDQKGGQSVLTRNTGLKKKELEAFMKDVPLDKLPSVAEAKAVQEKRRKTVSKSDAPVKIPEKGVEASKFLKGEQQPFQAPEPTPAPQDPEIEALKKRIADAEAAEVLKLKEYFALEQRRLEFQLDREKANSTALREAEDLQALNNLKADIRERRSGVKGIWEALEDKWNPQLRAERAEERRREIAQLKRRQAKERADWEALHEQTRQLELENLKERQAQQLRDRQQKFRDDEERHIREHEKAKQILAQIQAEEKRELERNQNLEEGPEPPGRGKKR